MADLQPPRHPRQVLGPLEADPNRLIALEWVGFRYAGGFRALGLLPWKPKVQEHVVALQFDREEADAAARVGLHPVAPVALHVLQVGDPVLERLEQGTKLDVEGRSSNHVETSTGSVADLSRW